ncbi:MAG: hypothetical protein ABI972_31590 [Acidobacteriota bacterium]
MRDVTPGKFPDDDESAGDYELAEAVSAPRATPARKPTVISTPMAPAPAAVVERYPHRAVRIVAEEPDAPDSPSPVRNFVIPIALLSLGLGLRIAQLLYANEGNGNRWAGNLATPGGVGKAVLLVTFEMIIASAIMGLGAMIAATLLGVEFGPIARAVLKLSAAAVFAIGVASWVALFDQHRYSVGGLVLALHVMVILNWITRSFFFKMELQELLLTVAIVTALHAVAIAGLWHA